MKNYTTFEFCDTYTETVDKYGNVKIYANGWKDDDKTATVRLAVADDNREESFSTQATDLIASLKAIGNVRGVKLAVVKPYEKKDGLTTFMNVSKFGGRVSIIADKPAEATAKPSMVWVNGYYRSTPAKK